MSDLVGNPEDRFSRSRLILIPVMYESITFIQGNVYTGQSLFKACRVFPTSKIGCLLVFLAIFDHVGMVI